MQKRVFLEANVHKRGLESVFEIAHLALEDAADEAFLGGALDVEFLELVVFGHGHAGLEDFGVDDDFLVDFLLGPDEALHLFDDVAGGVPDGFDEAFRLLGDLDGLELLLGLGGQHGAGRGGFVRRIVLMLVLVGRGGLAGGGHALGGQAGGDVLGALDLAGVPAFEDAVGTALFGHDIGARGDGLAVGFGLVLGEPAFGFETHSAAAPRKIIVAHGLVSFSMDVDVLHQAHGDQGAQH